MRKLVSVVIAAGLLASLSACANTPFASSACTPSYTAGSNSALVTAKGKISDDPKADFPTPLVARKTQVTVVTKGDGAVVATGSTAVVQITIYDGKSGERLISTDYTGTGLLASAVPGEPDFGGIAQCATVGSRVAAVGTAGDLIGLTSIDQNSLPLTADDTVVLIADVNATYLGRADGADQVVQAGYPSIALAPDGRPGFTFPNSAPPTSLMIADLKVGNGAAVKKGDQVVLNYTGVLWDTKEVFDSTWKNGTPVVLGATSLDDGAGGLVPGFAKALIGQKIGSQVIVVIPPKFGYPSGQAPASIPDGSTMVFVFDVLGIVK